MTDFCLFFLSKKRRTRNKLLPAEIMRNSRGRVSCVQHLEGSHVRFQKNKLFAVVRKFEWCQYNFYAYASSP